MTYFADAFNRGQDVAKLALQARYEVADIFRTASQQLSGATGGRIALGIQSFDKPRARTLADLVGGAVQQLVSPPAEQETWIAANNPLAADLSWTRLAKWSQPREGYPCSLSYDKHDLTCHDKEALEEAIAELLASAWAGERLLELLDRPLQDLTDQKKE